MQSPCGVNTNRHVTSLLPVKKHFLWLDVVTLEMGRCIMFPRYLKTVSGISGITLVTDRQTNKHTHTETVITLELHYEAFKAYTVLLGRAISIAVLIAALFPFRLVLSITIW